MMFKEISVVGLIIAFLIGSSTEPARADEDDQHPDYAVFAERGSQYYVPSYNHARDQARRLHSDAPMGAAGEYLDYLFKGAARSNSAYSNSESRCWAIVNSLYHIAGWISENKFRGIFSLGNGMYRRHRSGSYGVSSNSPYTEELIAKVALDIIEKDHCSLDVKESIQGNLCVWADYQLFRQLVRADIIKLRELGERFEYDSASILEEAASDASIGFHLVPTREIDAICDVGSAASTRFMLVAAVLKYLAGGHPEAQSLLSSIEDQ